MTDNLSGNESTAGQVPVGSGCVFGRMVEPPSTIFAQMVCSFATRMNLRGELKAPRAKAGWFTEMTNAVRALPWVS